MDVVALREASGFEFIPLRDDAVNKLLVDEITKASFLASARLARKLFKALLPDPAAAAHQGTIAAIRTVAERITDLSRPTGPDLSDVTDAVDELLDRSVGAEEYVIRAAAEGSEPDPLIDLSKIDFDSLAAAFAGRKRAETDRLAALLKERATAAATRKPTRQDLVERIEELIAQFNAGSLNIDEYLRRLVSLNNTLSDEERRTITEGLDEQSLAVFDLLTTPEPELTDAERASVKESAKELLAELHEWLVFDWRRKTETMAGVRTTIKSVLDDGLPDDPYPSELFDTKVDAVFNHIVSSYAGDGASVYSDGAAAPSGSTATLQQGDGGLGGEDRGGLPQHRWRHAADRGRARPQDRWPRPGLREGEAQEWRRLRQPVDHPPHQRDWQCPGVANAGTDRCARGPGDLPGRCCCDARWCAREDK